MRICFLGLLLVAGLACSSATAQITASVGASATGSLINVEDFEAYLPFSVPPNSFSSPGGFDFDLPWGGGTYTIWYGPGLGIPGGQLLYQNGGATSVTSIRLTTGADIGAMELDVGNGWGTSSQEVLIRAYDNGGYTGYEFNFYGSPAGTYTIQSIGTPFDEVRIQSFFDGLGHVAGSETQYGAVAIDNVKAFSAVPEPSAIALVIVLGAIGSVRSLRRRRSA